MSKKNDAAVDAFLADVLAQIPEDKRAAVEEAFGQDGVKTKLRDGVLARQDYSRSMDDLTKSREQLSRQLAEAQAVHDRNVAWYNDAVKEYQSTQTKLSMYEQTYGSLDNGQPARRYLTKEELQAELDPLFTTRDTQAIDVAVMLSELGEDYRDRFNERLNRRDLIKFATEHRMSLDTAYDKFIADKSEAKRKKEFDEAVAKAREDGAKEALSKHNLPVMAAPQESYSFETTADTPKTQHDRVKAAMASFNASANLGR